MRLLPAVLGLVVAASAGVPTIAVATFDTRGAADSSATGILTEALVNELAKTGQVRVMERAQMRRIFEEQRFEESGACGEDDCAQRLGHILSVRQIAVGTLGRLGGTLTLSARMVDVETGEVLQSSSRQECAVDQFLVDLPGMARELLAAPGLMSSSSPHPVPVCADAAAVHPSSRRTSPSGAPVAPEAPVAPAAAAEPGEIVIQPVILVK